MATFAIYDLPVADGQLGLCPAPGRYGDYAADLAAVLAWEPAVCLTMTAASELERIGAGALGADLAAAGVEWRHLPIRDFGAPAGDTAADWPAASEAARAALKRGDRVLTHCFGGCGRSGMAVLRLLVELGEPADQALARLRAVRPCAVETEAQRTWAASADQQN